MKALFETVDLTFLYSLVLFYEICVLEIALTMVLYAKLEDSTRFSTQDITRVLLPCVGRHTF